MIWGRFFVSLFNKCWISCGGDGVKLPKYSWIHHLFTTNKPQPKRTYGKVSKSIRHLPGDDMEEWHQKRTPRKQLAILLLCLVEKNNGFFANQLYRYIPIWSMTRWQWQDVFGTSGNIKFPLSHHRLGIYTRLVFFPLVNLDHISPSRVETKTSKTTYFKFQFLDHYTSILMIIFPKFYGNPTATPIFWNLSPWSSSHLGS